VTGFEMTLGGDAALRLAEPRLAQPFAELVARNRERLDRWEAWAGDLSGVDAARAMLTSELQRFAAGTTVPAFVMSHGQLAGYASLRVEPVNRSGALGYWIGADFGGRGLATAAVGALARFGVDELALVRVSATIAVGNVRSTALVRRLGFRLDGVLRSGQVVRGAPGDVEVWSLLPGEFGSG